MRKISGGKNYLWSKLNLLQVLLISFCFLLVVFFCCCCCFNEDVLNDKKERTVASAHCVLEELKEDGISS